MNIQTSRQRTGGHLQQSGKITGQMECLEASLTFRFFSVSGLHYMCKLLNVNVTK